MDRQTSTILKYVLAGMIGLFLIFTLFGSFVIVDAGHVGVLKTFGAVHKEELAEGFHFKKPFIDSVEEVETRLRPETVPAAAASKDLQQVQTQITVTYSVANALAAEGYQHIGNREQIDEAIIDPAIQESLKAVTARYTAEQLVTKREMVKGAAQRAIATFIKHTLDEKQLAGFLAINQVAITDFQFSEEFNRSIEAKVKAEQEALKAINEKVRRITEAEAAARERELAADAAAYKIEKESKARAAAIRREAQALARNKDLVRLRGVERWNGQVSRFQGKGIMPFVKVEPQMTTPAQPASGQEQEQPQEEDPMEQEQQEEPRQAP